MCGFGIVWGPILPLELIQQLQGKPMSLTADVKADFTKFESWIKTLELKFFKGKLHQKVVSPHPGETPDHVWIPVASHDAEAPAAGEPIVEQAHDRREGDAGTATGSGQTAPQQAGAAGPAQLQASV